MTTKNDVHAKITERDGRLVATALTPDSDPVTDAVFFTHLPTGGPSQFLKIAFYDMDAHRAQEYTTGRLYEVLHAIAEAATAEFTKTGEQWYALRVELPYKQERKIYRLSKKLNQALELSGAGWVNPIILPQGSAFLLDLVLSHEEDGRRFIGQVMKYFGAKWTLTEKQEGTF